MKNLKVSLGLIKEYPELRGAGFLVDTFENDSEDLSEQSGSLIAVKGCTLYKLSLGFGTCELLSNLSDIFPYCSPSDLSVIGISYELTMDWLTVGLCSGDIISICTDPIDDVDLGKPVKKQKIAGGLKTMKISPDSEIGVCITNDDLIVLVTCSSDSIVAEVPLHTSEAAQHKLVSVGWGRKETQFHGSEGKQAAVASAPVVNPGLVKDEHGTCVTWRSDSSLFAVGYWCPNNQRRRVKIFTKDGILETVSEDLPGLEDPLAWRPSGNIALVQTLPNKYVISFMEKNGLKHNEFPLPSNLKVTKLLWNSTSSILCTVCQETETNIESLLFWTVGNYHWYMKQKMILRSPPTCLLWDKARPNRIHGICLDGLCFLLEFTWSVDRSEGFKSTDPAYVGVIDGNVVKVTSFRDAVIPPPLSQYSLESPSPVNRVVFPPKGSGDTDAGHQVNVLCSILDDSRLVFFHEDSEGIKLHRIAEIIWEEENPFFLPLSCNHWLWVTPSLMITCGPTEGKSSSVCVVELLKEHILVRKKIVVDRVIIACSKFQKEVLLAASDGHLFRLDIDLFVVTPCEYNLREPCFDIDYNSFGELALSGNGRLFLKDVHVANNITSIIFIDPYILATTADHHLLITQPNKISKNSDKMPLRKLERGSKLVTVCGDSVVMQLPRGNLETIQPRGLAILSVGELIQNKKYNDAMRLMRRQRIDLNLCVDHNFQQFLQDIEMFIIEIEPQWLTLLIADLYNGDSTKSTYATYYFKEKPLNFEVENKVNVVCSALYEKMNNAENRDKYLLPILSCLVRMEKTAEAIKMANSEQALKYLLFLVDVDTLYKEALLSYDLEAALRIASKSLMDPKEYIPYLNSLKAMDPPYMRYTIEKSLGKPYSALLSIVECNEEDKINYECFEIIKKHSLYREALDLFKNHTERYKTTAVLYGDYLYNKKLYSEAVIMYSRGGNLEKAIQSSIRTGNWRKALCFAKKLEYSEDKMKELSTLLCNLMRSSKQYNEAAVLCLEYLSDVGKAIEMTIQGRLWQEALYITEKYPRLDFNATVKNGLLEAVEGLFDDIKQKQEKISKHSNRLKQVREEKIRRMTSMDSEESSFDTESETSSTSSTKSSVTRTSKNTRKTERKKWSLKEGNPREEQALLATLSEIIQTSEKLTGEVRNTCLALLDFNEDDTAQRLQKALHNLLVFIGKVKPVIWPKDTDAEDESDRLLLLPPPSHSHPNWELENLNFFNQR